VKRDLDLVRDILLFFEARESVKVMTDEDIERELKVEGYTYQDIAYHLRLMAQANLLTVEVIKSSASDRIIKVYPFELSWEGHEFLQLSKDNTRWQRLKKQTGDGFRGITFSIAKELLVSFAKSQVGLP
jgi:hypothetical protein